MKLKLSWCVNFVLVFNYLIGVNFNFVIRII